MKDRAIESITTRLKGREAATIEAIAHERAAEQSALEQTASTEAQLVQASAHLYSAIVGRYRDQEKQSRFRRRLSPAAVRVSLGNQKLLGAKGRASYWTPYAQTALLLQEGADIVTPEYRFEKGWIFRAIAGVRYGPHQPSAKEIIVSLGHYTKVASVKIYQATLETNSGEMEFESRFQVPINPHGLGSDALRVYVDSDADPVLGAAMPEQLEALNLMSRAIEQLEVK